MTDLVEQALALSRARVGSTNRETLRARGVVATPAPLARHAIARVDALLQSELGMDLSSEQLAVLDPAVGTGVWLAALLEHTRASGTRAELLGFDVDRDALRGVEALLAPEAAQQGARLTLDCANTLSLAAPFPNRDAVRVILGNPPWAARSLSRGTELSDAWLTDFQRDEHGAPLRERRLGVLSDDYVRFFRWALEQARTSSRGAVVCLATNASFLDGPVHRGMRASLLRAFDRIEVVDLGGNSLLSRDVGQRDENLFGVRVGAALTWAVRRPHASPRTAVLHTATLRGTRAAKLEKLGQPLEVRMPRAPWFRFRGRDDAEEVSGFSLDEAFPFQREGVQTNRDAIATDVSREQLEGRLREIAAGRFALRASAHFDPERVRATLDLALSRGEACIDEFAYRPFEQRYFVTLAPLCHRPRNALRAAMKHSSVCLLAVRKDRGEAAFNLFAAARSTADACFLSTRSSCRTRVFPSHDADGAENLAAHIGEALARFAPRVTSESVILYALSVLGSPCFRQRRAAALRTDYARIPWPRDAVHFARAQEVGAAFLRVLAAPPLEGEGDDVRDDLTYDEVRREVQARGRPVLHDVDPRWWHARVGHHALVDTRALSAVRRTLARAAAWSAAELAADALLFERA